MAKYYIKYGENCRLIENTNFSHIGEGIKYEDGKTTNMLSAVFKKYREADVTDPEEEFLKLLKEQKQRFVVYFGGSTSRDFEVSLILKLLSQSKQKFELDMHNIKIRSHSLTALFDLLKSDRELESLNLSGNVILKSKIKQFTDAICQSKHLQQLVFPDIDCDYILFIRTVSKIIASNTSIKVLNFNGSLFRDVLLFPTITKYSSAKQEAHAEFMQAMAQNTTLETLNLRIGNLNFDTIAVILESLRHNTGLTALNIANGSLNGETLKVLPSILETNTTLSSLDLSNNRFHEGVEFINKALSQNNGALAYLYLSSCQLNDKGAISIFSALKTNTTVLGLNLCSNDITEEGAKIAAEMLTVNTTLTVLDLSRNTRLKTEGVLIIAKSIIQTGVIKSINLESTFFDLTENTEQIYTSLLAPRSQLTNVRLGKNITSNQITTKLSNLLYLNANLIELTYPASIDMPEYNINEHYLIFRNQINKERKTETLASRALRVIGASNFFEAFLQKRSI